MTFSKRQITTAANQGREGTQRQRRNSQETIVRPWGRVLALPQGIQETVSLSSLQRGREELPLAQGQGQRLRVPGCVSTGAAERSYPMFEVRGGS